MGERHTRRQFVRRGSAAVLVAASTPALLAGSAPAATTAELGRRLRGSLVIPRDAGWDAARALRNPRLDVAPRAIAFCETTDDVAQVVRFARARGWPVAGRGGRHSFAGYGNVAGGIVADVSRIADVLGGRWPASAAAPTCSTSTATSSSRRGGRCSRRSSRPARPARRCAGAPSRRQRCPTA